MTWSPGSARALALAVLLAAALPSRAGSELTPACQRLDEAFATTKEGQARWSRSVSVQGRARALLVFADARAPSRAAAALLRAALRHAARYSDVRPARAPDVCALAGHVQRHCGVLEYTTAAYDNVVLSASMASQYECLSLQRCGRAGARDAWAPGPRARVAGAGAAPARPALLARLAPARTDPRCAGASAWTFYKDATHFQLCGFTTSDNSTATVYTLADQTTAADELQQRIAAHALRLSVAPLDPDEKPRTKLMKLLKQQNSSFLFLDYDLWVDRKGVISVSLPPSLSEGHPDEFDSVRSLKVADELVLREVAPTVLETLHQFAPSPSDLRQILEIEAEHPDFDIEDAACAWANNNTDKFASFRVESKRSYWIAVFLCAEDPDKAEYKKVANISATADEHDLREMDLQVSVYFVEIDCRSEEELNNEYFKTYLSHRWQRLIGVVGAGEGARLAAQSAAGVETALVLYDRPAPPARRARRLRSAAGRLTHLALAVAAFLDMFRWRRLALLTENTQLAKGLHEALVQNESLAIHNALLTDVASAVIADTLRDLQNKKARIIYVNTNADVAEVILCTAYELGMTGSDYAWILRDRRANELRCSNKPAQVEHFTISFWWRGSDHARAAALQPGGRGAARRRRLAALWGDASWPPLAAPLADSVQLLVNSFIQFAKTYPNKFYDLHGHRTSELLLNSWSQNKDMYGVVQRLQFVNGSIAEPIVFVDRWRGNRHKLLLAWRIRNEKAELLVQPEHKIYNENPPTDGYRFCMITAGDSFLPLCHDYVLYAVLGFVAVVCAGLGAARRVRLRRLARRDALLAAQLAAQRQWAVDALAPHRVDRAALRLFHELGRGCYGRVRYGLWRAPGRTPAPVAAKEARDDISPADEGALLREACTMATLRHPHVVKLVGICTSGGPTLILMEYAFFGNLREYLLERRHLAERAARASSGEDDEAYHVSAASLTRLAKEAASALEYLAGERLVHRDVRASNCLVDATRSLKLADFGLACDAGAAPGGSAGYACRRRALFPVLWMAPESLARGVFTAASDAWALGVLLLELVTLGARPYDPWRPKRVARYVTSGGCPPLPADINSFTRDILWQCWRSEPEQRLTAAALGALLEARPEALQPALARAAPPAPPSPRTSRAPSLADVSAAESWDEPPVDELCRPTDDQQRDDVIS